MQHISPRSWPRAWWRAVKSETWRPANEEGAEVAEVLVAGRAARALPARRDEAEHDVVAGRQPGDLGPDLDDLAGALVPTDHRELLDAQLLLRLVGRATRSPVSRCSSEWHSPEPTSFTSTSPRLGRVELDLLDAPVGLRLPQDRRLHLHRDRPFN